MNEEIEMQHTETLDQFRKDVEKAIATMNSNRRIAWEEFQKTLATMKNLFGFGVFPVKP